MITFPVDIGQKSFQQFFKAGIHEGTDIFAPMGAEVVAVIDGTIRRSVETKGGNVVYLQGSDNRKYFYAHLSEWDDGPAPRLVKAGEVIGYVGDTGNAEGRAPHLHFGIYVPGVGAIDPYPELVEAFEAPRVPLSDRKEGSHGS